MKTLKRLERAFNYWESHWNPTIHDIVGGIVLTIVFFPAVLIALGVWQ